MRKFCYKCGALEKDKGPLIDGLCQPCFAAEHPLLQVSEKIDLKVCSLCRSYFVDNEWHEPDKESKFALQKAAEEAVLSELVVARKGPTGIQYVDPSEAENVGVELESEIVPPDARVIAEAKGKIDESQIGEQSERIEVDVAVDMTTCDVCSRRVSGYYEAILQVRGEGSLPEERVVELYRTLENHIIKEHNRDRDAFVSQIERKHGGLDFYVSSAGLARRMAGLLKSQYDCRIDESAKLVGKTQDGRDKYRVSIVARLP